MRVPGPRHHCNPSPSGIGCSSRRRKEHTTIEQDVVDAPCWDWGRAVGVALLHCTWKGEGNLHHPAVSVDECVDAGSEFKMVFTDFQAELEEIEIGYRCVLCDGILRCEGLAGSEDFGRLWGVAWLGCLGDVLEGAEGAM